MTRNPVKHFVSVAAVLGLALTAAVAEESAPPAVALPAVQREFRAVWVATVSNIDWPSRRDLTTDQQKAELIAILDKCKALNLNAVVLQVRPGCDALYASQFEPWSEYLTGQMGKAPEPYYDPLEFAVAEAHKRGLELHAWFNPYRAHHPSAKSEISDKHISKTQPDIVKKYGKHLWLDPTDKRTMDHTMNVVLDVVKRYDVDGIHIDDYFYPYKEKDADGKIIEFPDDANWEKYQASGGTMSRSDWRRAAVNQFVQRFYAETKAAKPWVKVGISPFGIWKPGHPEQIKGFNQYEELYADARLWLARGWVDYWTPQLYWNIANPDQSFPVLLRWWAEQNLTGRHLWPGQFTSRVRDGSANWPASEIIYQIKWTRLQPGASGTVHFSMQAFLKNADGINDALTTSGGVYAKPAIVPACPWLDDVVPEKPDLTMLREDGAPTCTITWQPAPADTDVRFWAVQKRAGDVWTLNLVSAETTSLVELAVPAGEGAKPTDAVAVAAVDRVGNLGPFAIITLPDGRAAVPARTAAAGGEVKKEEFGQVQ
ncbi:MAG: family 10 glycosylhydrolase [Candidatus Sumerlaeaceae bacterium]|nr:family 10 glycosylhydrolase [Candidatus Sumerlaeaceae bacterium]